MKSPKIAVILFPGSNCELEALRAVKRSKMEPDLIRWNDTSKKLSSYDAFIIPGGFSYEDRGRSGVIASKDPIMNAVRKEALNGKPVLGICNGAQILVETGMIPGLNPEHLEMALAWNERIKKSPSGSKILGVGFYNDWVHIRHNSKPGRSPFTRFNPKILMQIPVAHGEGRFTTKDKTVLKNLIKNDQTLFRYCNSHGKFIDEFPVNPNGAMYNLAGVCNPEGNVMALMPHPERTIKGQPIFDSMAAHLKKSHPVQIVKHIKKDGFDETISPSEVMDHEQIIENINENLEYLKPRERKIMEMRFGLKDRVGHTLEEVSNKFHITNKNIREIEAKVLQKKEPDIAVLIRLIITDNEERTLENTLKNIGYKNISLYRQIYFGFTTTDKKDLKQTAINLIESGEILNLNKEIPTVIINKQAYRYSKENGLQKTLYPWAKNNNIIAMEYDNYAGKSVYNSLKNHKKIPGLQKVERGIHWVVRLKKKNDFKKVIDTHIFHNPHSMKLLTPSSVCVEFSLI